MAAASETGAAAVTGIVEQTLHIQAAPTTVWRYWTDPSRMADWWGAADLDPRPGGRFVVDLGGGAVMRGEYLELAPHERLVFTFGWDRVDGGPVVPPGSTTVVVTLSPDAGGTLMTVRHTGIPSPEVGNHQTGWSRFLPRLAESAHGPSNEEV